MGLGDYGCSNAFLITETNLNSELNEFLLESFSLSLSLSLSLSILPFAITPHTNTNTN